MTKPIQGLMGFISLSLLLMPLDMLAHRSQQYAIPLPAVMALEWSVGIAGAVIAVTWFRRWPSKAESLTFALIGNASIALWAIVQPNPLLGLLACTTLTISGGYLALFHRPGYTVYNLAVATLVGAVAATRFAATTGDYVHALLALFLVLALNTVAPFSVQFLIHALGVDVIEADHDPLTGLHNRRNLHRRIAAQVATVSAPAALCIAVIDLDDFKRLNDTHGHMAGDRALIEVAAVLRDCSDENAVLFRTGGEEFLIADIAPNLDPPRYAERVCQSIAQRPDGVTASIGTACLLIGGGPLDASDIDSLVAKADQAMYDAKRLGGNRIRHATTPG